MVRHLRRMFLVLMLVVLWGIPTQVESATVGPVAYDYYSVDDDNLGNSSGNDDGIASPDETIELFVALTNFGSDEAADVNATISTSSPYVTLIFSTSSDYGNIPGHGTATNPDGFVFAVSSSAPNGHVIHFDLDVRASNGGPWSDSFDVKIQSLGLAESGESSTAPPDYQPRAAEPLGAEAVGSVLVFEDVYPWGSTAIQDILSASGITFDVKLSAEMPYANLDLYQLVIIADDQTQSFYDTYSANVSRFATYVSNGGVLEFHAAGWGWNDGNPHGMSLPGGAIINGPSYQDSNYVTDSSHQIMIGVSNNPFTGDWASHGRFTNLPAGTTTIATEGSTPGGQPTLIEYSYGTGRVLAGTQTFSYGYDAGQDAGTILQNLIPYAYYAPDPLEPNDTPGQCAPILFGLPIASQTISPAGDLDYYCFNGSAGQAIAADIDANVFVSSLLDSVLTLFQSDGTTVLSENDDYFSSLDSYLEYTLPADGIYFLRVRDYSANGGPDYFYSLSLTDISPLSDAPWVDSVESGFNDWTFDGFWHQVQDGVSPYPQSHSATHSWWYGQDATGDYDNGFRNWGSLISPWINVPAGWSGARLGFWSWYETEDIGTDWDQRWVQISVDGGPFQNLAQLWDDPMQTWIQYSFDLPSVAGSQVKVRFYFDTIDDFGNSFRGWYVDDVAISSGSGARVYLPIVLKAELPPPTCLYISNDTGGSLTYTVFGTPEGDITCQIPAGAQDQLCGCFTSGTYNWQVVTVCDPSTASGQKYYEPPEKHLTPFFCR